MSVYSGLSSGVSRRVGSYNPWGYAGSRPRRRWTLDSHFTKPAYFSVFHFLHWSLRRKTARRWVRTGTRALLVEGCVDRQLALGHRARRSHRGRSHWWGWPKCWRRGFYGPEARRVPHPVAVAVLSVVGSHVDAEVLASYVYLVKI